MTKKLTDTFNAVAVRAMSGICSILRHRRRIALLIGIAVAVLTIALAHGTAMACNPATGKGC